MPASLHKNKHDSDAPVPQTLAAATSSKKSLSHALCLESVEETDHAVVSQAAYLSLSTLDSLTKWTIKTETTQPH